MKFQDATKLSDILELAIADLHKIEENEDYDINMGVWHSGGKWGDASGLYKCEVCLAGAVMANSLGATHGRCAEPYSFDDKEKKKLFAVNDARMGFITCALANVGVASHIHKDKFPDRAITPHNISPEGFYLDMEKLIADLRVEEL